MIWGTKAGDFPRLVTLWTTVYKIHTLCKLAVHRSNVSHIYFNTHGANNRLVQLKILLPVRIKGCSAHSNVPWWWRIFVATSKDFYKLSIVCDTLLKRVSTHYNAPWLWKIFVASSKDFYKLSIACDTLLVAYVLPAKSSIFLVYKYLGIVQ